MPGNNNQVHLGFITGATTLYMVSMLVYFGYMGTSQSETNALILAYKATELCIGIEKKPDLKLMDYDTCLHSTLEPVVWSLIKNGDLNLKKCEADVKEQSKKAWCTVWVHYWWRKILITNKRLVEYIGAPAGSKPPIPRQEDEPTTTVRPLTKEMPTFKEFAMHKMNEVKEAIDSVFDLDDSKMEDIKDNIKNKVKSHKERANRLVNDLGEGIANTANYVVASVMDLRDKMKEKQTPQKPSSGFEQAGNVESHFTEQLGYDTGNTDNQDLV